MISAIILTKNEEKNIKACINSVSWCDEIIVLDDNSIDRTVDFAKKTKANVIIHSKEDDFSAQRNFGLQKAKGDWILFVDADERVSPALWYEIMQYTSGAIHNFSGFYLKRVDHIWGKNLKYGETGNIKLLRLARKETGEWEGRVHERWKINGEISTLNNPLEHYPHINIAKFLQEINLYTTLRSIELYEKKIKSNWFSIVFFPSGKFFQNYLIRQGFKDGVPGLLLALMMSFHSFLVRSKLWLLWQKKKAK